MDQADEPADAAASDADPQVADAVSTLEGAVDWFTKAGSDSTNDQILQVADEVIRGRHEFKIKIRRFLKREHWQEKMPTTKVELEEQLASYDRDYESTRAQAMGALTEATGARSTYKRERQSGAKKVGRVAQGFVKSFADFLHAYSGIIELLRSAGHVYGDVAYETLSILFIVVVNKSGNDGKIASLLLELRKSFPQLDDWTNIYPSPSMKTLVTEVYKQVIEFAREASIYFTRFSTRLWMAIGKPPSVGIDKTAARVHKKLAEVSSEAMIQLHKRSQSIHVTVEDSNTRIKELERLNAVLVHSYERLLVQYEEFRAQVELEQENQDKQHLEMFKETLKITYPSPSTTPSACASTLAKAFPQQSPSRLKGAYQYMTPDFLDSLPAYTAWSQPLTPPTSALLVLAGRTAPEARQSRGFTHSWLSPATLQVVEMVRGAGGRAAFYSCHPGVRADVATVVGEEVGSHTGRDIIASLAYQLLEARPKALRRTMAQLQAIVRHPEWLRGEAGDRDGDEDGDGRRREKDKAAVHTWFLLLREVLAEMRDDGVVYLVLDRVDLVEGCTVRYFMEELVGLVRDEKYLVKILAVMSTARGLWDAEDMQETGKVMVLQDLDQKKLGLTKLPHSHRAEMS